MNKFKKVLTMILVGVVLLGGVVFANPVEFDITTKVPNMAEMKVHRSGTNISTIGEFNELTGVSEHDFGKLTIGTNSAATVKSGNYYVSVKTNAKNYTFIKATFGVMVGEITGKTLDYTLNYGTDFSTKASDYVGPVTILTVTGDNGARVVTQTFSIDILGNDIAAANPDTYSAKITFEYTSN